MNGGPFFDEQQRSTGIRNNMLHPPWNQARTRIKGRFFCSIVLSAFSVKFRNKKETGTCLIYSLQMTVFFYYLS